MTTISMCEASRTTRGRWVSEWAETGVITKLATSGMRMGPPAAREYAVEPVGLVAGHKNFVDVNVTVIQSSDSSLTYDHIVQGVIAADHLAAADHFTMDHRAGIDIAGPFNDAFERGVKIVEGNFSEEAESAQ